MSMDSHRRDLSHNESTSSSLKSSASRHAVRSPPPMHFGRSTGFPPLQSLPPVCRHANHTTNAIASSHSPRSTSSSRATSTTPRSRAPARTSPSVSQRNPITARSARNSPMPRAVLRDVSGSNANAMRSDGVSKRQRDDEHESERSRAPPRCSPSAGSVASKRNERHRPWAGARPASRALTPLTAPAQPTAIDGTDGGLDAGCGYSPKAALPTVQEMPIASGGAVDVQNPSTSVALPRTHYPGGRTTPRSSMGGPGRPSDVTVSPMSERGDAADRSAGTQGCLTTYGGAPMLFTTDDDVRGAGEGNLAAASDPWRRGSDDVGARSTVLTSRDTGSGTSLQVTSPDGKQRRSITSGMTSVVSKAKLEEVFTDLEARYQQLRDRGAAREQQARATEELAAQVTVSPPPRSPKHVSTVRTAEAETEAVDDVAALYSPMTDVAASTCDAPPMGPVLPTTAPEEADQPAAGTLPMEHAHPHDNEAYGAVEGMDAPSTCDDVVRHESCSYQPFQCDSAVFHCNRSSPMDPSQSASEEDEGSYVHAPHGPAAAAQPCEHIQPTHLSFTSALLSDVSALTADVTCNNDERHTLCTDAPSSILEAQQSMRSELDAPALLAQADALFDKFKRQHQPVSQPQHLSGTDATADPPAARPTPHPAAVAAALPNASQQPPPLSISVPLDAPSAPTNATIEPRPIASPCVLPMPAAVAAVSVADAARALGIDVGLALSMMRRHGRVLVCGDPQSDYLTANEAPCLPDRAQIRVPAQKLMASQRRTETEEGSPVATKPEAASSTAKRDANGSPLLLDAEGPDNGTAVATSYRVANTQRALYRSPPPLEEPHASHLPLSKGWLRR